MSDSWFLLCIYNEQTYIYNKIHISYDILNSSHLKVMVSESSDQTSLIKKYIFLNKSRVLNK